MTDQAAAYFYRPIAYYAGRVLKCAGMVSEQNREWVLAMPGTIILPAYAGDRIKADDHNPWTSL